MDGIDEIVGDFLVESYDNLDQLDRDFVELEQRPDARDLLASVFRTIHTIKGTSGFLAFHQLEAVTHVGENLLAKLRDGVMVMTPSTTDVLLEMVDTVRALLAQIEASGAEGDVDVSTTVAHIQVILDGGAAAQAAELAAAAGAPAPGPAADLDAALEEDDEDEDHDEPEDAAPVAAVPAAPVPAAAPAPAAPAAPAVPAVPAVPAAKAAPVAKPADDGAPARRSAADSSIRVDIDVLDDLMRLVGELVLTRNQILQQTSTAGADMEMLSASQRLNLIAGELQEGVMKTRMQPIDTLWSKLPRVVRDLGSQCGKQVRLEMVGADTELDRTLLEAVKDPLTHLVRNSVDHGVEKPEDRVAAGKPAEGVLTLRARHESGQVVVEVCDDGGGMDGQKLAAKAIEKGLLTAEAAAKMSSGELLQLIFTPGFSTAAAVTNVSGRGVGMDVVKTNIEAIGGTIEIESTLGKGTINRLRIPLTLAIVPALTVECSGDRYALPQVSLQELVALDAERAASAIEEVGGAPVYRLRGELLPLVRLADVLGLPPERTDGHIVMAVLRSEGRRFGLVVDRVINTEEIVVKAVSGQLKGIGLYSGATILGDGTVALILDVQALARRALKGEASDRADLEQRATTAVVQRDQMLISAVGGGRRVAIPLSMVTRLERIKVSSVETVGHREVVQYRGAILPIIRLDRHLGAAGDVDREDLEVVVYADHGRSVAIVVEEVLDIVDSDQSVHSDIDDYGLVGSAVIDSRVTELLDVRAAIVAADPGFFAAIDSLSGAASFDPYTALQEA